MEQKHDRLELLKQWASGNGRKRRGHQEDKLQMACKMWFDLQYPKLRPLLHHSPNEGLLPKSSADGAKRKAMGVRAGFPDFILLVPTGNCPYLAIELKTDTGKQNKNQKLWQQACEMAGGCYVVVRSIEEFKAVVDAWMSGSWVADKLHESE